MGDGLRDGMEFRTLLLGGLIGIEQMGRGSKIPENSGRFLWTATKISQNDDGIFQSIPKYSQEISSMLCVSKVIHYNVQSYYEIVKRTELYCNYADLNGVPLGSVEIKI